MAIGVDKINNIKLTFNSLKRSNEENVKILVVVELLKALGYDANNFDFEHPVYHQNKIADIVIQIDNKNFLYVEVKRGDLYLEEKHIIQLATYLNIRSIEWGILTNGREIILLNNKILTTSNNESALEDKIVFKIDLITNREIHYLQFISKEAIFDKKTARYFKDIAQYKAYKYPNGIGSWNVYKGTLYNFFTFYANKEDKYRPLEQIRIDDFEDYLVHDQKQKKTSNKTVSSQNTFKNKYSHIRSMFIELKKHKYIPSHHFEEPRKMLVENLDYTETKRDINHLNEDNVIKILNYLATTDNAKRDRLIFLLCVYMGLERSVIRNLNWKMFDFKNDVFIIKERKIPLPIKLSILIQDLFKENKNKKIKGDNLFYTYYSKKHNIITESSLNEVFDRIQKINENDGKWKFFSAQYIRNCLIEKLFENYYSIEEIAYLTGMDLVNISKLLSYESICAKVNLKKESRPIRKHPFEKIFNNL